MKIGLVTYHFGYNEGTMLQAYSSLKLIEKHFPDSSIEILDWRYPPKEAIAFKKPTSARERAILRFFNSKLKLSSKTIRSLSPQSAYDYMENNYAIVVIGSDEVWRLGYESKFPFGLFGKQVPNPWAPPFPNVYWPAREGNMRYVSLSSSISDNDNITNIPFKDRAEMKSAFLKISPMSVRDSRTENFINKIIGTQHPNCKWMPDPTFSLQMQNFTFFSGAESRLDEIRNESGRKIALIVSVRDNPITRELLLTLRSRNYTTVSLTSHNPSTDYDLSQFEIDPLEWAHLLGKAELIITERFHGAVFALRNNTPVIALGYRHQRSTAESKLFDLFKRFTIPEYFLDMNRWSNKSLDSFKQLIDHAIWPSTSVKEKCDEYAIRLESYVSDIKRT